MSTLAKLLMAAGASAPTEVGTPWGGGYYVGRMKNGTNTYALVVSPKEGEGSYAFRSPALATLAGMTSTWNGAANMADMVALGIGNFPAANFCRNLRIGGFDDWVLPAAQQLELVFRYLKCTTRLNNVSAGGTDGTNPYADPPTGPYTTTDPAQTAVVAFQTGGAEALSDNYYRNSTKYSPTQSVGRQHMGIGQQIFGEYWGNDGSTQLVRAVRMVQLS